MPIQRLARTIRELFQKQPAARAPAPRKARLELQSLEDRCVPALNPMATITGALYLDSNLNNHRDVGEGLLTGERVTLVGTTTAGGKVNTFVTTNAAGLFRFRVDLGNYKLIAAAANYVGTSGLGHSVITINPAVDGDQLTTSIRFLRVSPTALSLRRYLATTPVPPTPVFSTPAAGGVSNRAPTVGDGIAAVSVTTSTTNTNVDLGGAFTDADLMTSRVRIHTNKGDIDLNLFDRTAPYTVGNFYGYVLRNDYDNVIFHRLGAFLHDPATTRDVLQGGGFRFSSTGGNGQLSRINPSNTPTVRDEVSLPNVAGTISMAKGSSANSATSEFFFNLIDNTTALRPRPAPGQPGQDNGGFTVFGRYANASQPVIDLIKAGNVQDKSTATDETLKTLPLRRGAGTNFPTDTVAGDYTLIQDVEVMRRNEFLTYSLVSNTNPGMVTTAFDNNRLTLNYVAAQTGTATITVKATDRFGASVMTSFTVTRRVPQST